MGFFDSNTPKEEKGTIDVQECVFLGQEVEKKDPAKAMELYEKAIAGNFDGNFPYDRLAIAYRKQKDYDNEIRVLNKAIYVFENIVYPQRSDPASPVTAKNFQRPLEVFFYTFSF